MIQKRYQRFTKDGIEWSSWYNYSEDDRRLEEFIKRDEGWQLKNKLKNEYRIKS